MKQYLLGIDVGTTGTKTLLFDAEGAFLGRAYRPYDLHHPRWAGASKTPRTGGTPWWRPSGRSAPIPRSGKM